MADEARSRLGRGLASLIGDVGGEAAHLERPRTQRKVPIEYLKPNPRNPRRTFSDAELSELSESIKQHGVIQPIVVRPVKGVQDRFEIIAGERRWRASQIAGLHEVPIVPVDVSDSDALEIAIIENVQREDLNAMDPGSGAHPEVNCPACRRTCAAHVPSRQLRGSRRSTPDRCGRSRRRHRHEGNLGILRRNLAGPSRARLSVKSYTE